MLLGVSMYTHEGMVTGVAAGGLTAGIVHMFNHALIKGGLFMVVGCFAFVIGSVHLKDWRGAGKTMPLTSFAWVVGGLALIGVPMTAGFISKWLLLTSAIETGWWTVAVLMLCSSLLAVVYVWRVVETLYFSEPEEPSRARREAPAWMLIPTYAVVLATLVFGVWTEYSVGLAGQAANLLLGGTP